MGKHGFHFKKGGFDYDEYKRKLERVNLPDKILCKICGKICNSNKFSNRQLDELRKAMAQNPNVTGLTRPGFAGCRACISHQVVELTCSVCDKTKSLEYFSKNQRSSPDTATEVNEPTTFHNLTIHDEPRPRNLMDTEAVPKVRTQRARNDREDDLSMGGVWVDQGDGSTTTTAAAAAAAAATAGPKEGIEFTGFDNKGVAHPRKANSNAATPAPTGEKPASAANSAARNVTTKERRSTATPRKNSNFAKVTGGRIPKNEGPSQRLPEPAGPTIESDDDDSDDECGVETWI
ncbi:conserved hypothetical protein [Microsporum canis CBS 113480]|uniref:Stc1 domain-containing protein n=1 Tax=Arthroderma otae (strain ATCC MYA-4605 / CBS 113480) TaxID=554155 RepID=C5FPI1_ARTOC|nr:conserved hypothetical protein [Microsporum canis CBS 113480]EEQ31497.1 conserved hypothetical protein [Microsporum canis CBS 113480]